MAGARRMHAQDGRTSEDGEVVGGGGQALGGAEDLHAADAQALRRGAGPDGELNREGAAGRVTGQAERRGGSIGVQLRQHGASRDHHQRRGCVRRKVHRQRVRADERPGVGDVEREGHVGARRAACGAANVEIGRALGAHKLGLGSLSGVLNPSTQV